MRRTRALKTLPASEPSRDCALCPRLKDFREAQRAAHPDWFNAPVPVFGDESGELLIVGLAPGMQGANRTGRPFTGDYAGDLLYATLAEFGFSQGSFAARSDDGLTLHGALIANAVRCLPPQNKPLPAEIKACNPFLRTRINASPGLKSLVALGRVAHDAVLSALDARKSAHAFAHGAQHDLGSLRLFDSYHCSRYNTNTRVLTPEMFRSAFAAVREYLERA